MIAYLNGQIFKKVNKGIILDTGNIGYLVHLPTSIMEGLNPGQQKSFYIYSHIREDIFDLYGFENESELKFFKDLISISGIGPKLALDIFSVSAEKVKIAIIKQDSAFITTIPGIGQKTAQRIILELKNKISIENIDTEGKSTQFQNGEISQDALEALLRLGYQRNHVMKKLQDMPQEIIQAEEIITYFLKNN